MENTTILQFSIGRSGSTMIWQILKKLCEPTYKVLKCHPDQMIKDGWGESSNPIVITQRDPRDSILSFIRVSHFGKNTELFESNINRNIISEYIARWKNLENILRYYVVNYKGPSVVLRYEDFYNNYEYIFNKLSSLFDLNDLSPSLTQEIINDTNLNKNLKHQSNFSNNFEDYSEETGIHGGHIKHPNPESFKRLLNREDQDWLSAQLADEIRFWDAYWGNLK